MERRNSFFAEYAETRQQTILNILSNPHSLEPNVCRLHAGRRRNGLRPGFPEIAVQAGGSGSRSDPFLQGCGLRKRISVFSFYDPFTMRCGFVCKQVHKMNPDERKR